MNSVKYVVGIVAAFSLTGCAGSGGAPDSEESTPSVTGNSEQAVTLVDCQKQVTACVKGARSFLDLGGCTAKFQGCTTQAAVDLVGQGNLLKNCRASANA